MKMIRFDEPTSFLRDWDAFFADPYRAFAPFFQSSLSSARETVAGGVEWYEDDENYYAQLDLPGFRRDDLKLDAEDGLIHLTCEVKGDDEKSSEKSEYVVRCPESANVSGARATLERGVLRVTLPKREERRPVRIEVK